MIFRRRTKRADRFAISEQYRVDFEYLQVGGKIGRGSDGLGRFGRQEVDEEEWIER